MSNWGAHQLPRAMFAEEFTMIVANLEQAMSLDDAEIVGEFLHCLRILGASPQRDPELVR